jgi:uncharacterized membrane protein
MILAAYRDTGYNIVLFLHILTVIVAFAPAVSHPLIAARLSPGDTATTRWLVGAMAANGRIVHLPALVLTGVLGIVLILMSDEVIEFSDVWISLSFLVWIALGGVVSGMIMPNERRLAEGDLEARRKIDLGGQIVAVLLLVMLYLMIFKPGS